MILTQNNELHFAGSDDQAFLRNTSLRYKHNVGVAGEMTFDECVIETQAQLRQNGHQTCIGPVSAEAFSRHIIDAELANIRTHQPDKLHPGMLSDGRGSALRMLALTGDVEYVFEPRWTAVLYTGAIALASGLSQARDEIAELLIEGSSALSREATVLLNLADDETEADWMLLAQTDYDIARHALQIYSTLNQRYFSA